MYRWNSCFFSNASSCQRAYIDEPITGGGRVVARVGIFVKTPLKKDAIKKERKKKPVVKGRKIHAIA
jgi:hypothetical protein